MAIAEQFAGLKMDELIGGPLSAAADASKILANSTASFIKKIGFDKDNKVRTVAFMFQKRSVNEDGTSNLDEMKVDVPMLAIVPIPNLQIDEVNVLFDMEVKQSEKEESSMDIGASLTGTVEVAMIKVSVTGNISSHSSNTRSSDNSAKYHVDVRASNHGTPEGLARVLDMMAANISPALVSSSLKDGNGQNLSENARIKAEKLKALRTEIAQIENRLNAAQSNLDNKIKQLKSMAGTQQNVYKEAMIHLLNGLPKSEAGSEDKTILYSQIMDEINQSWNTFQNQVTDYIRMVADSGTNEKLTRLLSLKALSNEKSVDYGENEKYYNAITMAESGAVSAQQNMKQIEEELFAKKAEYSDAVAGKGSISGSGEQGKSTAGTGKGK